MHDYRVAQVLEVVDSTTVRCLVDLGFGLTATLYFQLLGIDPPECYDGEVTSYVRCWLSDRELIARTTPYNGTAVGVNNIWLCDFIDAITGEHLLAALIDAGYGS